MVRFQSIFRFAMYSGQTRSPQAANNEARITIRQDIVTKNQYLGRYFETFRQKTLETSSQLP